MSASVIIGVRFGEQGELQAVRATIAAGDALAHHRAVVGALRAAPMAPLRCGAATGDLSCHAAALRQAAAWSADHVEIGATLTAPASIDTGAADGRGFLRRAAARGASAAAFAAAADAVERALRRLPDVADVRRLSSDGGRVSLAVRARREAAAGIAAAAEAMTCAAAAVETSGPWPLYSFAFAPTGGSA